MVDFIEHRIASEVLDIAIRCLEAGVRDVTDISFAARPKIVDANQLLDVRPFQKGITKVRADKSAPARYKDALVSY